MCKERPILFNGDMVRALLDGRKTQTRRAIKLKTGDTFDEHALKGAIQEWRPMYDEVAQKVVGKTAALIRCPYGQPGDRLWVRETFAYGLCTESTLAYRATHKPSDLEEGWHEPIQWKPTLHMPRWASRITLEVVSVRVERLQDISEADAKAEGVIGEVEAKAVGMEWFDKPRRAFQFLWQRINGGASWDANPWVWVVEFKRVEAGHV